MSVESEVNNVGYISQVPVTVPLMQIGSIHIEYDI